MTSTWPSNVEIQCIFTIIQYCIIYIIWWLALLFIPRPQHSRPRPRINIPEELPLKLLIQLGKLSSNGLIAVCPHITFAKQMESAHGEHFFGLVADDLSLNVMMDGCHTYTKLRTRGSVLCHRVRLPAASWPFDIFFIIRTVFIDRMHFLIRYSFFATRRYVSVVYAVIVCLSICLSQVGIL